MNEYTFRQALESAQEKYTLAQQNLKKSLDCPVTLHSAAQEANDAWLQLKKAEDAASNYSTLKKIGDLYGG